MIRARIAECWCEGCEDEVRVERPSGNWDELPVCIDCDTVLDIIELKDVWTEDELKDKKTPVAT